MWLGVQPGLFHANVTKCNVVLAHGLPFIVLQQETQAATFPVDLDDPVILWRCYVACYHMGLPSVSDLVRTIQDNPFIPAVCGIESPEAIPSQPTFLRFLSKLSKRASVG